MPAKTYTPPSRIKGWQNAHPPAESDFKRPTAHRRSESYFKTHYWNLRSKESPQSTKIANARGKREGRALGHPSRDDLQTTPPETLAHAPECTESGLNCSVLQRIWRMKGSALRMARPRLGRGQPAVDSRNGLHSLSCQAPAQPVTTQLFLFCFCRTRVSDRIETG